MAPTTTLLLAEPGRGPLRCCFCFLQNPDGAHHHAPSRRAWKGPTALLFLFPAESRWRPPPRSFSQSLEGAHCVAVSVSCRIQMAPTTTLLLAEPGRGPLRCCFCFLQNPDGAHHHAPSRRAWKGPTAL